MRRDEMGSCLSDEELARRAADGRLEAFEELLQRHRQRVFRLCHRRAGNREDAEDWAQECFVRLYQQLNHYDSRKPFSPWMLRVVSNACINKAMARAQQKSRLVEESGEEDWPISDAADPLKQMLFAEEKRRLNDAVALLPPLLQQAVVLRALEGLSFKELAEILNAPLQTAASRVRRGLTLVRERLENSEAKSSDELR